MANQITVNSGSGNITVTTSRAVIGTVANVASANYANFAGEVVDPSQPNITSVGNLTSLNVTGTTTTGNLVVQGNLQVGNLVANTANYANFAGNAFAVAGANVSGTVANATYAISAGSATTAGTANSVAGANVTGTVANATFATTAGSANTATVANSANSVTLANVSGAGNIASINLDGSTSNVLYGNGAFAPAATGNVANANYANFAGTAFSVSGSNVSGTVANATYAADAGNANTANSATVANSANAVAGANVSGTVANATFALDAGNANIANIAYSVSAANVSGLGNIATINLDGNVANVLKGNGTFGPEGTTGNANYANFAGTAFSVSGSNVSGAVANATYANDAGNANIANTAYAVSGANVSGAVANATYANDAGNANIANTAYSVSAANVSGLGNIATINLDGNVSNLLTGNGTYVAIPTVSANANYANFAGDVVNATQSNITQTGNLVSLTVDANIANSTTVQTDGNLISFAGSDYYNVTTAYNAGAGIGTKASQAVVLVNGDDFDYSRNEYYINKSGNAKMAYSEVAIDDSIVGNSGTDPLIPGSVGWTTYTSSSNLANASTATGFGFTIGGGSLNLFTGAPINGPAISLQTYGNASGGTGQQGIRFRRRGGNADTRTNVAADYYLGNIEWQGAATATGGYNANSTTARVVAKVESTYANTGPIPTAIDLQVSNGTTSTHQLHANGNVTFANVVNATTFVGNIASSNVTGLGNIATINLDGNASNLLNGAGSFVAIPTDVANANYANFAGDVVNATQSNITQTGNLVSLTVDANIANSTTVQINGNLISYAGANYYSVTNAYNDGAGIGAKASQAIVLVDGDDFDYSRNEYYINKSGNAKMAYSEVSIDDSIVGNSGTDPLIPGSVGWTAFTSSSNLASASTATGFGFTIGGGSLNVTTGAPINNPAISMTLYGNASGGTGQQAIRFRRRGGNADTRTNVAANYYLGNIEWQGAATVTGGFNTNSTTARVSAKVESTYANTGPIPTALEFQVSNGTTSTHNFHANGNVTFSNAVNANTLSANYLYGDGSNITGVVASTAGTVTTNAQPNITSVGTLSSLTVSNNSSSQAIVVNQEGNGGISSYNMYTDTSVFAVQNFYRTRGNSASRTAVGSNDTIFTQNYGVYGDSGNMFVNAGYQENKVGTNYGNGQVSLTSTFAASYAGSSFNVSGYDNVNLNGNTVIGSNKFMQLSVYTAAALTAITGAAGQIATVSNSTPGGMMAFWDTTNNRWSYVHDNSAV